jgi:ATP-dependent exoDNAse (exonuclease V) alpha subunit
LDAEQAAAAGLVVGDDRLVVVIGPAGAGKTRAMSAAVRALEGQGRAVIGLAPWAVAAEQLAQETGVRTETVERFLREHELPQRSGSAVGAPAGMTVIVDEAGLLGTEDAERLMRLARDRGWRVALVGDGRQLAAVGRSGMFDQARTIAPLVQLREVRRFAAGWEREASAALRECDAAALDAYQQHGRVQAGSARELERALLDDWWQTVSGGRRGAFTVSTNDRPGGSMSRPAVGSWTQVPSPMIGWW